CRRQQSVGARLPDDCRARATRRVRPDQGARLAGAGGRGSPRADGARCLARAAEAPADKAWRCGACGAHHETWHSVCESCGAFGTLHWRAPGTYGQILPPEVQPAPALTMNSGGEMFETTLAGSLPKPSWLATPNVLWAPWTLTGAPLQEAKEDATALAIRRQEEAGIDIVSDGEQARQHFVHGFLAEVDGVDFGQKR